MEFKVLEESKSQLVFELSGETHTFCNALKKELQEQKGVKTVTYRIDHPLARIPTIIVEADDPKKSLKKAVSSLKKEANDFLSKVEKEL